MAGDGRPAGRLRRLSRTVRFRVTALTTLAVLAVLVAAAGGLVVAQSRVLRDNLDEAIVEGADNIEAVVATGRTPGALGGFGDDDTMAQVVAGDGRVVAATPNAGVGSAFAPTPATGDDTLRTVDGLAGEDAAFRLLSRRVPRPQGDVVVHVAGTLDDIEESTEALTASLVLGIPTVVVLLAALVWWMVGRTLRSVEAMRAEVAGIGGTELHRRVPVPPGDDEVSRLARTMNDMLGRIDVAAERQRRFVADASHELRSPITRLRSELEVDLAYPDRADPLATHRSALDEVVGLQRLVDDLLHLARHDADAPEPPRTVDVDLDDLVLAHAARLRSAGRVTVDTTRVGAARVRGDPRQLGRAIGNLVDNAGRHAAGRVTLAVGRQDADAVVTVADDGPGIPPGQAERVFERFARLDDARHPTTGGTGLGLAIARGIVERHGGTLRVDAHHHPGAMLVLTLPAAPP